jgi:hypothetical protein
MDIFAHALWAGAAIGLTHRRWPVKPAIAVTTVVLAALPDIPHLQPLLVWSIFEEGRFTALGGYAIAVPGQEPDMLPIGWVTFKRDETMR